MSLQQRILWIALKPLTGKIDQGGGLVWRYQDENNYYVARWNPLEGDFRLFKVIDGKRTQLGDTVKLASKVGEWHTITDGKMKDVGQATVGKAPKRVAFVPVSTP